MLWTTSLLSASFFFSAVHTVLSINYSSAVGMSVIDGGGGLSALRMTNITVERRYVSNDPWSALQVWLGSCELGRGYKDIHGSLKFCDRGSNFNNVFFVVLFCCCIFFCRWGDRWSKYYYKLATICPSAKRHLNGASLVCEWWPNMDADWEALWFFRGSGPVVLRNPILLWFFRGGGGPDPLHPFWIRARGIDNRSSLSDEFSATSFCWFLV